MHRREMEHLKQCDECVETWMFIMHDERFQPSEMVARCRDWEAMTESARLQLREQYRDQLQDAVRLLRRPRVTSYHRFVSHMWRQHYDLLMAKAVKQRNLWLGQEWKRCDDEQRLQYAQQANEIQSNLQHRLATLSPFHLSYSQELSRARTALLRAKRKHKPKTFNAWIQFTLQAWKQASPHQCYKDVIRACSVRWTKMTSEQKKAFAVTPSSITAQSSEHVCAPCRKDRSLSPVPRNRSERQTHRRFQVHCNARWPTHQLTRPRPVMCEQVPTTTGLGTTQQR